MTQKEQGIPVEAGRELDMHIAVDVMGLSVQRMGEAADHEDWYYEIPDFAWTPVHHYSTDMVWAVDVMNHMDVRREGAHFTLTRNRDGYRAEYFDPGYRPFQDIRGESAAPTAPLAICLAAWKAVAHLSGKPSVGEPVR